MESHAVGCFLAIPLRLQLRLKAGSQGIQLTPFRGKGVSLIINKIEPSVVLFGIGGCCPHATGYTFGARSQSRRGLTHSKITIKPQTIVELIMSSVRGCSEARISIGLLPHNVPQCFFRLSSYFYFAALLWFCLSMFVSHSSCSAIAEGYRR
jgi:hypothetical protein